MALTKIGKEGITGISNASDATAITIDASENVGIGTSSPNVKLSFGPTIGKTFAVYESNGSNLYGIGMGGDGSGGDPYRTKLFSNGPERVSITSAGNVGIGTNSPATQAHILKNAGGDQTSLTVSAHNYGDTGKTYIQLGTEYGDGSSRIGSFNNAGNQSTLTFETHTATSGSWAEAMRIDSSGNVLVGRTSQFSSGKYSSDFTGTSARGATYNNTESFNASNFISFGDEGTIVGTIVQNGASTVSYTTSSDYRLKENVDYTWDATTRLKQLKPARFNFIGDADKTVDGFLAHEVSSIVPEAISGTKDAMTTEVLYVEGDELPDGISVGDVKEASVPDYQGIDQSKLVPLLVKTIQELEARLTAGGL